MSKVKRWYVSPRTIELFLRAGPSSEIPPGFVGLTLLADYDAMAHRCREAEEERDNLRTALAMHRRIEDDTNAEVSMLLTANAELRAEVERLRGVCVDLDREKGEDAAERIGLVPRIEVRTSIEATGVRVK